MNRDAVVWFGVLQGENQNWTEKPVISHIGLGSQVRELDLNVAHRAMVTWRTGK